MTGGARVRRASLLPASAAVAVLLGLTYESYGYRFPVWPQPGFLDHVLRFDGRLGKDDWQTSLPPAHWFVTHMLALEPWRLVPGTLVVSWLLALVVFWTGFVGIVRLTGASLVAAVAAGALALPTAFDGVGVSTTLYGFVYPNELAFAVAILAFSLAMGNGSAVAGGALLGLAILLHPGMGVIAALVVGPAIAILRPVRYLGRFVVAAAVVGGLPVALLVHGDVIGNNLSARRRFDLLAVVRQPQHMLYAAFPGREWLQFGLWAAFALAGVVVLAREGARLAAWLGAMLAAAFALMAVGAAADALRWPLVLVQLQTSRASSFVVLAGVVGAVVVATRALGPYAAPALLAAALVGRNAKRLHPPAYVTPATVAALAAVACVGVAFVALRYGRPSRDASWLALVAVAAAWLVVIARTPVPHGYDFSKPWKEIAADTRARSRPTDIVMVPPQLGGFRTLAQRPIVVDFGAFAFGDGAPQWIERLIDVTGDRRVASTSLGDRVPARLAVMGADYRRRVAASAEPICKYGVRWVVTEPLARAPRWLRLVDQNTGYQLYRVRAATCAGSRPAPA